MIFPSDEIHTVVGPITVIKLRAALFEYSLEDAVAVTKIGEKMIPLSIELTRIVGQPLFDVARMATGQQVEWYLIRKAFEYGDIVPNKPSSSKFSERKGRSIVGGYVQGSSKRFT